jgi:hypothetical protein
MPPDGERGWACDENPAHFQFSPDRQQLEAAASPRASAADGDAGSTPGKQTIGSPGAE